MYEAHLGKIGKLRVNKCPTPRCRLPLLVFALRDSAAASKGGAARTRGCRLAGAGAPEFVAQAALGEPEER